MKRGDNGSSAVCSGNEKDFARIGILHLLARCVSGNVNITAARIERTKDVPGLTRNWLRCRKLRLGGGVSRRGWRCFWSLRDRTWAGVRSWRRLRRRAAIRLRRRGRDGPSWRGNRIGARGCCRGRRGFAIDMPADVIRRRVDDPERANSNVVGGAATGEKKKAEKETSGRFHGLPSMRHFRPLPANSARLSQNPRCLFHWWPRST